MVAAALTSSACAQFPLGSTKAQTKPVTATTDVPPGRGAVVFSDDFHDSGSGWTTGQLASGTSFAYQAGAYVVIARQQLHHLAYSPYRAGVEQLGSTITATLVSTGTEPGGFGVICRRGQGSSAIRYEFLLETDGTWYVERGEGTVSTATAPDILKQGSATSSPGGTPLTLEGLCATFEGKATTRLLLFIGSQQVCDITDTPSSLPNGGWTGGMVIASGASAPTTVRVTSFVERDAAG